MFAATSISAGTLLLGIALIALAIYAVGYIAAKGAKRGGRE